MCLTIPGKIIDIKDNKATIEYRSETKTAKIVTGSYHLGDYVIVQAGMVIERVPKKQAESWNEFLSSEA